MHDAAIAIAATGAVALLLGGLLAIRRRHAGWRRWAAAQLAMAVVAALGTASLVLRSAGLDLVSTLLAAGLLACCVYALYAHQNPKVARRQDVRAE